MTMTAFPPALHPAQTVLEAGGSFAGVNRKVQLKPTKWSEPEEGSAEQPRITEALLILKHGGVLTHAGRQQACAASSNLLHLRLSLELLCTAPVIVRLGWLAWRLGIKTNPGSMSLLADPSAQCTAGTGMNQ